MGSALVRQLGSIPIGSAGPDERADTRLPAGVPRPSPEAIAAVRRSCRAVAARPVRLAESFYAHLFEMAPQVRAMFPDDMTQQMQKMADTLMLAVSTLETPDTAGLEAALRQLGADHKTRYGVEQAHYMPIGHALTRAVREVSGLEYSGYVSSAWIAVYQWVAAHMTEGAQALDGGPAVEVPQPRRPGQTGASSTTGILRSV